MVSRQRQKNRFRGASLAFVAPGDIVGAHLGMVNINTACAKGVHASITTLRNLSVTFFGWGQNSLRGFLGIPSQTTFILTKH